ncbi:MAG: LLM class F420-dependent oxidoreductase [Acidimicrobiia bacterium]|nr:LLM class F420-dependent oxidoreductase [Acidimicrobiia bacterium]
MEYGINIFATDLTMQPLDLARHCERLGFESLWLPEHSHIPTSRATPWGGRKDAPPLPEKYWRCHDTLVAIGAMAAVTENLRFGSGITLLAQRDPIWTAKEVATIDQISQGRFMFGVGYGWNIEEMNHHGTEYKERRALLREKVLMMKALWTEEEASFDGEHISLEPSWAWPKPVQQPHPPVVLGGRFGPKLVGDLVDWCDGWLPYGSPSLADQTAHVRHALEDAGRDPENFTFTIFSAKPEERMVEWGKNAGVDRILFGVESNPPAQVLEDLESIASFVSDLE